MNAHENTLHWNPRRRNSDGTFKGAGLEGSYMGVELIEGDVYQFDVAEQRTFGISLTPGVFTGVFQGYVDSDREPVFRHVDDPNIIRCPRTATWFERLDVLMQEAA